jgi:N-acetylglucosamine kinase-like BadF-type ATPase
VTALFLGIDGGGTKTAFVLVDSHGALLARHDSGPSYYLEIGFEGLRQLLHEGVAATLRQAGAAAGQVSGAFAGLPAYGEDSTLLPAFDGLLPSLLPPVPCRVHNDMVCSWAGSLAGGDGISIVAGTGSIAYGEVAGRSARCGGWGEVFGDEGSAHWLAREALGLFSRMADGRAAAGPLLALVREHFQLSHDLDLCAAINGQAQAARSHMAQLARLLTAAAAAGDAQAQQLIELAGQELAALAAGVARGLSLPAGQRVVVSYSGGLVGSGDLVLGALRRALPERLPGAVLAAPRFSPAIGAALVATRLAGLPLDAAALERLASV